MKIQRHTPTPEGPIPMSVHKLEFKWLVVLSENLGCHYNKIKDNRGKSLSTITKNLGLERLPKIKSNTHSQTIDKVNLITTCNWVLLLTL